MRVFITRRIPPVAKEMLSKHFEVRQREANSPLPRAELAKAMDEYDAILTTVSDQVDRKLIENAKKVKALSNYAVGLDNIDLEAAREMSIAAYNTTDAVTDSTADFAYALLFALIRHTADARQFVRDGKWKAWDPELFLGEELGGKTLGIIGFGKVGKAVGRRAEGFGLRVLTYNTSEVSGEILAKNGSAKQVPLDELLKNSDYITVHVPLRKETDRLVSREMFRKMAKRPIFMNLARGGVVDTAALVEALEKGWVRGAALDVTDPEPLPAGHRLLKFKNCIVTPHIGTATAECRERMAAHAAHNIMRHFGVQG